MLKSWFANIYINIPYFHTPFHTTKNTLLCSLHLDRSSMYPSVSSSLYSTVFFTPSNHFNKAWFRLFYRSTYHSISLKNKRFSPIHYNLSRPFKVIPSPCWLLFSHMPTKRLTSLASQSVQPCRCIYYAKKLQYH